MVKRVAIFGGGMAGLSAAWALSATPQLRRRVQITIYERSWLMGGKGASVRGRRQRIEEHGLHVVMGHYHRVLALLRECYRELDRPDGAPMATFEQALRPLDHIVMGEATGSTSDRGPAPWRFWECVFPQDGDARRRRGFLSRVVDAVVAFSGREPPSPSHATLRSIDGLFGMSQWLRFRDDEAERRLGLLWGFFGPVVRGILRDRVLVRGFETIDDEDFRAWLARHGASQDVLDSPLVRVMYDVLFARLDGNPSKERLAAGVALRFGLRMLLDYDGGFFWMMQAGMGEIVFAPLYQVLRRRGVKVRLFHQVEQLSLDPQGRRLASVRLRRLATARGIYEPLEDVDGLPCWRSAPDPTQLLEGEALRDDGPCFARPEQPWPGSAEVVLQQGRDFDAAILAIPVGALGAVLGDELRRMPRFAATVDAVPTNGTLACQLWLRRPVASLRPGPAPFAMTTFADPMATVADMSHLLATEGHDDQARGLLYLTSSLPPRLEEAGTLEALRQACAEWLERHGAALLPGAVDPETGAFDWSVLHDPEQRSGARRLEAQYFRINASSSERYTLAPPGGTAGRLPPEAVGVEHLYVAGDWTRSSLDCGCLEAATDSGMRAAAALLARLRQPHRGRRRAQWLGLMRSDDVTWTR